MVPAAGFRGRSNFAIKLDSRAKATGLMRPHSAGITHRVLWVLHEHSPCQTGRSNFAG